METMKTPQSEEEILEAKIAEIKAMIAGAESDPDMLAAREAVRETAALVRSTRTIPPRKAYDRARATLGSLTYEVELLRERLKQEERQLAMQRRNAEDLDDAEAACFDAEEEEKFADENAESDVDPRIDDDYNYQGNRRL